MTKQKEKRIVAMGGGGFSMEPNNPLLDDYVLSLSGCFNPKVCFIPTASGDSADYIVRFYRAFGQKNCKPTHLELFRRTVRDLEAFLMSQDILYVGGGNTANMLAAWRVHELLEILRAAWEQGTVLCGISAGSGCWFESCVTDSWGELGALDCLGFLPGSNCPHYDSEPQRRPVYQKLVQNGMASGIAAEDGVGLCFVDRRLERVVTSREGAKAFKIESAEGGAKETPINADFLGRNV